MKFIASFFIIVIAISCNNSHSPAVNKDQAVAVKTDTTDSVKKPSFFRVTSYFKGQLKELENIGIAPLKYIIKNGHRDSVWLKWQDVVDFANDFMTPEIDSTNLTNLFEESSFVDRSIGAATFTYSPKGNLPDSMQLRRWDVYVHPETGKVRRVFLVKSLPGNITRQLTWVNNSSIKVVEILDKPNSDPKILKDETISWDYFQK